MRVAGQIVEAYVSKQRFSKLPEVAILHLIHRQTVVEGHAKDHEFSGASMREHRKAGYRDTWRTLR